MTEATSPDSPELAGLRRQIDAIDDKIVDLLIERTGVVSQVGGLKNRAAPGVCPIRPGREADMVRRIMQKFDGAAFPPAAAAALWRIVIGASTSVESALTVSVLAADGDHDLFWLAHEYFGPAAQISRQPQVKRVIGDVMDGKASVGIVPPLRRLDATADWWTSLLGSGKGMPKIFARLPFVYPEPPGQGAPMALAIARIAPEASGDDVSFVVLETGPNVSQSRLQTAFATARLEANWINIATLHPDSRHHLVEVKGFLTPENDGLNPLTTALGDSLIKVSLLGNYAAPVMLTPKRKQPYAAPSSAA
ncbi:MAG: chorismate mutase [Pseudomonadota bacterium]|nr:chorismate mutase [Pseudomonadota bacterium]MDE3037807.1 chorismate mutase [Pseudomonadota bacterium]